MATKREAIIQTAAELIEMQGYTATGINEILEKSGAPKGSLYYYFPNGKEELAGEAIERSGRLIEARIREVVQGESDAAGGVRAFFSLLSEYVAASGYRQGGPVTAVAVESASTHDALRLFCRDAYRLWQQAFAERLREQVGEERAAALATLAVAALEGAIILCRTERSPEPLLAAGRELERLIRAG